MPARASGARVRVMAATTVAVGRFLAFNSPPPATPITGSRRLPEVLSLRSQAVVGTSHLERGSGLPMRRRPPGPPGLSWGQASHSIRWSDEDPARVLQHVWADL